MGTSLHISHFFLFPHAYTGKNDVALQEAKDVIARIVKQRGFKLIGVRLLPTDNKALGASALATEPHVLQMFVENTKSFSEKDFDRYVHTSLSFPPSLPFSSSFYPDMVTKPLLPPSLPPSLPPHSEMFRVRKLIEAEAELSPHLKDLFICSLSNQTLTYKGQLTPEQLYGYYGDLQDKVRPSLLPSLPSHISSRLGDLHARIHTRLNCD